jgi:hypothetical protein
MDRNFPGQRDDAGRASTRRREGPKIGRTRIGRLGPVWLAFLAGGTLTLFILLRPEVEAPVASPVPSPTAEPVTEFTPAATPGITKTATPVAGPSFDVGVWALARGQWKFGDLHAEDSGYREGQVIPFLLRIDDASPGAVYRVSLRYGCAANGIAAFDFLTGNQRDVGSELGLPKGPADSAIPVPDDPAIRFDDEGREAGRSLRLWGATFDSEPVGPAPDAPCTTDKQVDLSVRAHGQTLYMLWGGHLASSAEWGESRGAANHSSPLTMRVTVPGLAPGSQELAIVPGAVSP